ncbi:hypothetical protein [Desulfoluna sp.]|uniref:hypothetical protein n=1 Tax=Desulfoluna sp. TaxID=2045199 RepID=UPI002610A1D6|nr:hypothetical protein [Desulfoluna sp.]
MIDTAATYDFCHPRRQSSQAKDASGAPVVNGMGDSSAFIYPEGLSCHGVAGVEDGSCSSWLKKFVTIQLVLPAALTGTKLLKSWTKQALKIILD